MKRILSLMLVLLLLFSAGCKQQDADPATPGEVVERTETETPETDLPEVVEQEENTPADTDPEQTPSGETEKEEHTAVLVDYYVCKYYISLKDEYVAKNYTEANFPEMDITDFSVKTYKYPDGAAEPCASEFYLTVETSDWGLLKQHFQNLKNRKDIHFVDAAFKAYLIEEKANKKDFPELYREVITQNQNTFYDGVVSVQLKEGVPPSPSLFSNLNIDGISGDLAFSTINIYVKERGMGNLSGIIKQLEKNENVEEVDYLTKSEIITTID